MRKAVDYWKLKCSESWSALLSTPKLSNADQEREAGGVHGIDLALRYTT